MTKLLKKIIIYAVLSGLIFLFKDQLIALKEPALSFVKDKAQAVMESTPELAPITNVENDLEEVLDDADTSIVEE